MRLVEWDASLVLGDPAIDRNHREKFEQINDFFARMMHGEGREAAIETIGMLSRSMQTHFAEEEALMTRCRYPDFARHRRDHQDFLARLGGLRRPVEAGARDAAKALLETCGVWMREHILTDDKALAQFLKKARAA